MTDVYIDTDAVPPQGIFLACYDRDGKLQPTRRIGRMAFTSSGYVKESSGKDEENGLSGFRESIRLIIDNRCDTNY